MSDAIMTPATLVPAMAEYSQAAAGLQEAFQYAVDSLTSSSADVATSEQLCQSAVSKLQQLLSERRELVKQAQSNQDPDLLSKLTSSRESSRAYMHHVDKLACDLRAVIDACSEGLSDHKHTPDPKDILLLARRLQYTSFDTLGVLASQPPAPQFFHMQYSKLAEFNREHAAAQTQTHQPASASASQLPSSEPPKGWKEGDPVIVPEGWKPGDPVPLPGYRQPEEEEEEEEEEEVIERAPAYQFMLNPDMMEDLLEGEEVSDDYSDEDED